MIVRELVTRLGFDADDRSVQSYDRTVKDLRASLLRVVAAATAVSGALFGLAQASASYGDEVAKTSRQLGISTDALQAYRFAFERAGVSSQELTSNLERFQRRLGQAQQGTGAAADAYRQLGFEIEGARFQGVQTEEAFREVIHRIADLDSETRQAAVASDLFGRSGMRLVGAIRDMDGDIDGLVDRFKELHGGLGDAELAMAEDFQDAMLDMRTAVNGLRLQLGAELMPAIAAIVEGITDWVVANREIIMQRMSAVINGLRVAIMALWTALSAFVSLLSLAVDHLGGFERVATLAGLALAVLVSARMVTGVINLTRALRSAAIAMAAFQLSASIIPLLIAAIGVAAYLILTDIHGWMQGHPSAIEGVIGKYEEWEDTIEQIKWLVDQLGAAWNTVAGIIDTINEKTQELVNMMPDWLQDSLRFVADVDREVSPFRGGGFMGQTREDFRNMFLVEETQPADIFSPEPINPWPGAGYMAPKVEFGDVNITVPEGTTQQQSEEMMRQFDQQFKTRFEGILRDTETQNPRRE